MRDHPKYSANIQFNVFENPGNIADYRANTFGRSLVSGDDGFGKPCTD
jgi:hypothetical protein